MVFTHARWAIVLVVAAIAAPCLGGANPGQDLAARERDLNDLAGRLLALVPDQSVPKTTAGARSSENTAKGNALRADMSYVRLTRAREALAQGDLQGARKNLDWLLVNAKGNPNVGAEAIKASQQLEALGERMLREAQESWRKGDPVATVRALRKVSGALADRPAGEMAQRWIEAAKRNKDLRTAISEADAQSDLDFLLQAAGECLRNDEADNNLKIVDLTHTPAADPAIRELVVRIGKLPAPKRAALVAALRKLADAHGEAPTGKFVKDALDCLAEANAAAPAPSCPAAEPCHPTSPSARRTKGSGTRVIRID
jgi:hypothetical protein